MLDASDPADPALPRALTVALRELAPRETLTTETTAVCAVLQGTLSLRDDGASHTMQAGDLALLAASSDARLIGVELSQVMVASYAGRAPARSGVVPRGATPLHEGLGAIVRAIHGELSRPSAGHERRCRALLAPLLVYAIEASARGSLEEAGEGARPASLDERRVVRTLAIRRAVEKMRAQPAARWTVEALARAVGLSRAALARKFLDETGRTPMRYLVELRMEQARRRLAEGDDSLAEIATQIGYESEFAFNRAFKRLVGEAPGAFRRRLRDPSAGRSPVRAVA